MKVLLLGGTNYVGRHIVESLRKHNHSVQILNRCQSNMDIYPQLYRHCADRFNIDDLLSLDWGMNDTDIGKEPIDCIIDVSAEHPDMISNFLDTFPEKINYYIFISTGSVDDEYCDHSNDISYRNYCDNMKSSEEVLKDRIDDDKILIVRPGYICGEFDNTNRFDYSDYPEKVYWKNSNFTEVGIHDKADEFGDLVNELMVKRELGIYSTKAAISWSDKFKLLALEESDTSHDLNILDQNIDEFETLTKHINDSSYNYEVECTTPSKNPFRYVIIDDFLKESYYKLLYNEFDNLDKNGFLQEYSVDYSPLNKWKICHLNYYKNSPFNIFFSQNFKSFINGMFKDIEITNNVLAELHFHPPGDNDGWIHTDYHNSNFRSNPLINDVNPWDRNSNYRMKESIPDDYIQNVRSIVLIYYLNPESKDWMDGDGGETGFFTSQQDKIFNFVRKIEPIPNRLLAYEVNPYSNHAVMMNNKNARKSFHFWYHSEVDYTLEKYKNSYFSPFDYS